MFQMVTRTRTRTLARAGAPLCGAYMRRHVQFQKSPSNRNSIRGGGRRRQRERELLKTEHASEALKTHTPQILRSRSLPLRPNLPVSRSIRPHEPCCTGQTRFVVSFPAKRKRVSTLYTFMMVTINMLLLLYYCIIRTVSIFHCMFCCSLVPCYYDNTEKYCLGVIVELKLGIPIYFHTVFHVFVKLS